MSNYLCTNFIAIYYYSFHLYSPISITVSRSSLTPELLTSNVHLNTLITMLHACKNKHISLARLAAANSWYNSGSKKSESCGISAGNRAHSRNIRRRGKKLKQR